MPSLESPRFGLPFLAAGQAQKELFHNEALTLIDVLLHPVAIDIANDPQNLTPAPGDTWLIGDSPTGDWLDRGGQIAGWTDGGWRFLAPAERTNVFVDQRQKFAQYRNGIWEIANSIADPAGGSTIDTEARASIESILQALRIQGLIED